MKKKILIVDDAMLMRIMLRNIFEDNGYEVVAEADDADPALEMYMETNPDLVTMDLTLTTGSGIDAISKILNYDCEARIIVISAIEQRKTVAEALRLGAMDYIIKPFEENSVLSSAMKALSCK